MIPSIHAVMCPAIFKMYVPIGCSSVKSVPLILGSPFTGLNISLG